MSPSSSSVSALRVCRALICCCMAETFPSSALTWLCSAVTCVCRSDVSSLISRPPVGKPMLSRSAGFVQARGRAHVSELGEERGGLPCDDDVALVLPALERLPRRVGRLEVTAGESQHLGKREQRVTLQVDELHRRGESDAIAGRGL